MTVSEQSHPPLVESIPDPAIIRLRLDELRSEARILRELLPIAERRARKTAKQNGKGAADGR